MLDIFVLLYSVIYFFGFTLYFLFNQLKEIHLITTSPDKKDDEVAQLLEDKTKSVIPFVLEKYPFVLSNVKTIGYDIFMGTKLPNQLINDVQMFCNALYYPDENDTQEKKKSFLKTFLKME